jgi:two-component system, NtrC family, sensor histidine kinase GlrK
MRLVSRLVLSHTVLPGVLMGVLAFMLASLVQMTGLIDQVRERYLDAIEEDEALHRAGWAVEIEVRHGIDACEAGAPDDEIATRISERLANLREVSVRIGARGAPEIHKAVRGYDVLASEIIEEDTCERLRSAESRRERTELDEELTDAWISRLFELHKNVYLTGEEARRTGTQAIFAGAVVGILSLIAAALLAQRTARSVTRPLADLARTARRVGEGDFSPTPLSRGPMEVEDLSREIDRMRARLAELDALKQGFIASVSHELRTPLTKLREGLSLLRDGTAGPLSPQQSRVLFIAHQACEREIRIVTALLDLSRLRAGSPLKIEPSASLDDALHQAISEERSDAERRGVRIEVDVPGEAPSAALDGPMVERAVANILRNAVSVSSEGQIVYVDRAVLDHGPGERTGPWARIRVRDHGPGISAEMRATLFKPFVTYSVREHPERVGIGLGLALAREVAHAHGGDVELLDVAGKGAAFALWIPLYRSSRLPPTPKGAGVERS